MTVRSGLIADICVEIRQRRVPHTLRVAVDGPDAAGKSTLADELASTLGPPAIRLSIDGFHQPAEIRKQRGVLSAEGYYRDSFDNRLIIDSVLWPLGPGGDGRYVGATFDYRTDRTVTGQARVAPAGSVVICDGVFLLRPELLQHWDYSIYVYVDPEESIRRAVVRDLPLFGTEAEVERRYRGRYMPGQALYRAEAHPMDHADVVLDNTDPAQPVIRTV